MFKKMYIRIKNIRLWCQTVIKGHRNYKLSFYHKARAIKYGFSSEFYHMYNLEKNNPNDYVSEYKRLLSRQINKKYLVLMDNKIIFEKTFGVYVTIPKNIIIILDRMYDNDGNIISKKDFKTIITDDKYIIKPASDSGGGSGVSLINKINNNKYLFDNKELNINELYDLLLQKKGFVINEFVKQHEYSSKINPESVNTIRILTIKDPISGEFSIPCAVHRFGSKKSGIVDNVSSGGYVSEINVDSGIIGRTAYGIDVHFTDIHPDTSEKINGVKIPHWNLIKEKTLDTAKRFPYIPFIAWDIVVTNEGFSVIEINASTSLELFQVFGTIKNTKLGEFYKYYGYLK